MPASRLERFVARAGWLGCLGSIVMAWYAPIFTHLPAVQWFPWVAGLLVLGIPHGALDHRVGADLRGREEGSAGRAFYVVYLSTAALVLACWFVSPTLASVGFLAVAAMHFGQGDLYWSQETGLAGLTHSVGYRVILIWVRSILPIALPLVAFPQEFSGQMTTIATRLFGRSGWSVPAEAITWGLAVVVASVALHVAWALLIGMTARGETRRAAVVDATETLLLAAMFWTVPPVLAVGVYFNSWHSLRHVARLVKVPGPTRRLIDQGKLAAAFALFTRQALPMTVGAVAMMAGLGLMIGRGMASVADLGVLALVLLSALTLPHVMVVTWMDFKQGIWLGRLGTRHEEGV